MTQLCQKEVNKEIRNLNKLYPSEPAGSRILRRGKVERIIYNLNDQELIFTKHYGLCSVILNLTMDLISLKTKNIVPYKIKTCLTEYHNYDIYKNLFNINQDKIRIWEDLDPELVFNIFFKTNFCNLNKWGFGYNKKDIDFTIITPLFDAYFNLQENILEKSKEIEERFNINKERDTFVWWRRTDKPTEYVDYPTLDDLSIHLPSNKKIIFQTDDKEIGDSLKNLDLNIQLLDYIPYVRGNNGPIPEVTDIDIADSHLKDILALMHVASTCEQFIGYPGTLSQVICFLRRNFNNCIVFRSWPGRDTLLTQ